MGDPIAELHLYRVSRATTARIRDAVSILTTQGVALRVVEHHEEIPRDALAMRSACIVVLEADDEDSLHSGIARVPASVPSLLFGDFSRISVQALLALRADARVQHVVTRGVDDGPVNVAKLIRTALGEPFLRATLGVAGFGDWRSRLVVEHMIRHSVRPFTAAQIADAVGTSERSLRRWVAKEGLSVGAMARWIRLLRAAYLVGECHVSISRVAGILAFGSPAGVYRLFQSLVGKSLSTVDRTEVATVVREAFIQALESGADAWPDRQLRGRDGQ